MATSIVAADEDIFTCSICLKKFNIPKYLPCLHTFCEGCILTYITSGFEKGNKENIECPVCRITVNVPKENCSPKEWAKLLPLNFLISELMEKQKVQRSEKLCMMCERSGAETIPKACFICMECTDTLCDTCKKYHDYVKFSTKHEVKPLEGSTVDEASLNIFRNHCPEHQGKALELYCADHKIPCCSMCVSIHHRKCDKVISIEDAAKGFSSSTKAKNITKDIESVFEESEAIISQTKKSITDLESQYDSESKKIHDTCKDLISKVTMLEKERKDELLKVFTEKKDILETTLTAFENRKKAIENEKQILELCLRKASDVQTMIEANKLNKQIDEHKKILGDKVYSFTLSIQNTDDLDNIMSSLQNSLQIKCDITSHNTTRSNKQAAKTHSLNRFRRLAKTGSSNYDRQWSVPGIKDAISFSVSKEIELVGILSYRCKDLSPCSLNLSLDSDGCTLSNVVTTLEGKEAENSMIKVEFKEPVRLSANKNYDAIVIMNGRLCNYGEEGMNQVECEGVNFKFKSSRFTRNGTDVNVGQIPGFLFRLL